jgi:hypothetical protein
MTQLADRHLSEWGTQHNGNDYDNGAKVGEIS